MKAGATLQMLFTLGSWESRCAGGGAGNGLDVAIAGKLGANAAIVVVSILLPSGKSLIVKPFLASLGERTHLPASWSLYPD